MKEANKYGYEDKNYASFIARLGAYVIDGLIISAIITLVDKLGILAALGVSFDSSQLLDPSYSLSNNTGYLIATFIISILYYTILQATKWQATVGKKILGIEVTTLDGNRISILTSFLRAVIMTFISSIFYIGFLMFFFTKKKQTLHDLLPATIVVKAR